MDKIQAAIAKARASRQEKAGDSSDQALTRQGAHSASRDSPTGRAANLPVTFDRATAWEPLASFAPSAKHMARQRIVTFDAGSHKVPGAIAFDMLRTKVLQQMRANSWTRLAITSPGANCGKTAIAVNLAFSLARQPDIYTIVAEMDLLRPSMAKTFGVSGTTSFSEVISGEADFADVARRPLPNLAFGLNYARTPNSSELLQSSKVASVMEGIENQYKPDLMIFDMPPMLHSDDTMAFIEQVDCVLLIAAAESTSLGEIDVCERDLAAQTNVMGVLLNKCRYLDKDASAVGGYY